MAVLDLPGDPQDGSLGSGGNNLDDGPDFQFLIREGMNIFVAGDDPTIGSNLLIGAYMTSQRVETDDGNVTAYIQRLYEIWQLFHEVAVPDTEEVVTASLSMCRSSYAYTDSTYAKTDSMLTWIRDWTPPVNSDWSNLYQLYLANQPDITFMQLMSDRSASGVFNFYESGGERFYRNLLAKMADGSDVGLMCAMEAELYDYPIRARTWSAYFIASSGTTHESYKPKLRLSTVTRHQLNHVIGASLQMTDGTAVMFNYNPSLNRYELRYQKIGQTSSTLAATGNIGDSYQLFGALPGLQTVTICRDDLNNIYVTGAQGSTVIGDTKYFVAAGFKYDGNYQWTPKTVTALGSGSDHDGKVNNVVAAWLPQTGTGGPAGGTVAILNSRRHGKWGWRQQVLTTVNAGYLLGTTGITLNEKTGTHDPAVQPAGNWRPFNASGSGMDMIRIGTGNKLVIATYYPCLQNSIEPKHAALTSTIATDGTPSKPALLPETRDTIENDPNGKSRAIWMNSDTRYAYMWAGYLQVRNVVDNALFRSLDFTSFNITNFPSYETAQGSAAWDVIFDASTGRFWVYYADSQNPRLVRKVAYDAETNTLYPSIQLTPSVLGPSGSRIVALRAPRGRIDNRCVLVDVAMLDGALQPLDLIVLRDLSMNHAPNAPTVDPISSFNATSLKEVTWNFSDADPGDTALFQDVEVRRVVGGTTAYTSGKVTAVPVSPTKFMHTIPAGALTNDTQYQLRVRAYDATDGQGAWSDWNTFTTSGTGGHVVITEPPEDMPPMNVSSVTVRWEYTNDNPAIVQNGYQIRVYNNTTNALFSDTGIVASTATSRVLTGLTSNVQFRIEVAVRGSDNQLSGAAVRLIYPDYNNPTVPSVLASATDGTIEIRITNPPPTGENPPTVSNQIARKLATESDSAYVIIGTAGVNGTFIDHTVASGVDYVYKVRGVAGNGATGAYSEPITVSARLSGMWLSVPADLSFGTVQFPYGGVGRTESRDRTKTSMQFVGREYPVMDIGTAKAEALNITTQIPGPGENPDHPRQLAAARALADGVVVLYRDGRGRKMYASISNLSITDVEQGSNDVTMTLTRVDYSEAIS